MENRDSIRSIAYMGMYLALFFVFDWLSNQIPFFKMPQGGTLGLGVIPLILASYHLGWKKGLLVGVLSVVLQFMTGQMYLVQNSDGFSLFQIFLQFMMEYPVAFGVYGLSSLFPNYGKFSTGVMVTNLIRLALHVIAGTIYWATPLPASISYNAWYMVPTMLLSLVIVPLIMSRLKSFIK